MSGRRALIIGASRGIGLGLAEELAERGWHVYASQRQPSDHLARAVEDAEIEVVTADVTDPATLEALAGQIEPGSLDVVLVNAGIIGGENQSAASATAEEVSEIIAAFQLKRLIVTGLDMARRFGAVVAAVTQGAQLAHVTRSPDAGAPLETFSPNELANLLLG